jgi:hypothetical protein
VWIAEEEGDRQVDQNDRTEQNWDEGSAAQRNTEKRRNAANHLAGCDEVGLRRRKPKAAEKLRRPDGLKIKILSSAMRAPSVRGTQAA